MEREKACQTIHLLEQSVDLVTEMMSAIGKDLVRGGVIGEEEEILVTSSLAMMRSSIERFWSKETIPQINIAEISALVMDRIKSHQKGIARTIGKIDPEIDFMQGPCDAPTIGIEQLRLLDNPPGPMIGEIPESEAIFGGGSAERSNT